MKDILDEARELAKAHRQADPETMVIKFFPAEQAEKIRLLEVSGSAPTTGEVMPFTFPADPRRGVGRPSTVILLSPDEWQKVQNGHLPLPPAWDLETAEDL